ncbi:MAG: acyl-CoA dehydrogenase [Actinomycetota bacterium]|nr:MAG: acyl-CoA dehydrogenase [Actinomycetota bacterium]
MDVSYSPQAQAFRQEMRKFLKANLPSGWRGTGTLEKAKVAEFTTQWRKILYDNNLLALAWPKKYGGAGLSPLEQVVLSEEFTRAGVPFGGSNDQFGIQMVGNTLIAWGTEQQKEHFLPRILSGEDRWCQGYSEPNAGSDLANVGTKADLDGDVWVINGQKIWTSGGHLANWIFVLARTNAQVEKHKGISFLLVPMDQPGVEVRPIRMMSGESEFNEVFFTDAVTAGANVVGKPGDGWAVATTLLGYERGEAAATLPIRFRMELDRLMDLAKESGADKDPLMRQRLAWCYGKVEIMRFLGLRTLTGFLNGKSPGPESSISKLYWSEYHQVVTELAVDILGARALVPSGRGPSTAFRTDDPGAPNSSMSWVTTFLNSRAGTIYAGTSQIQRNILAEKVLGLPKEPKVATS